MIPRMKQFISQAPLNDPNLPNCHQMLGRSFTKRYLDTGHLDDIEAAVSNYQAALGHQGHLSRSSVLHDLAMALQHKFQKVGNPKDLDVVLQAYQQALDQGYPHTTELLQNLTTLLGTRYRMRGDLTDLDAALEHALEITDPMPQAEWVETVAALLTARYERLQNLKDLEALVQKRHQIVAMIPVDHPAYANHLQNLAIALGQRYKRLEMLKDLDLAIESSQKAVNITPKDHPDQLGHLQTLAVSLGDRYNRLGNLKDSERALQANLAAVAATPQGHPLWKHLLHNLAVLFSMRYERLAGLEDLEAGLRIHQTLLALAPKGHLDRASCLHNLAALLIQRHIRKGDMNDLQVALQMNREAINLTPNGDPDLLTRMHSLAASLGHRYNRLGDMKDLKDAVQINQEVVDLTPNQHPERPIRLQNFGMILLKQFESEGELQDLENALQKEREAIELTPKDHPYRAGILRSLLWCLETRYRRLGVLADLETALQMGTELLELTPLDHPDRITRLQNIATLFSDKFKRQGDLKDLDAEISTAQEAVKLAPEEHPERAGLLFTLASAFRARYNRLYDLKDIEMAIQTHQSAIELIPPHHPDRELHLQQLAQSFGTLYQRRGDLRNLRDALRAIQESLRISPQSPNLLSDQAMLLRLRYQRLGDLADLEALLRSDQQAFDQTPVEHPERVNQLGNHAISLRHRYQRLDDLDDLQLAIRTVQEAVDLIPPGHPIRAVHLQNLALCLQDRYRKLKNPNDLSAVHTCYSDSFKLSSPEPHISWGQAIQWATFAAEFQPTYCVTAYTCAFSLLPEILWISNSITARHDSILDLKIQEATSAAVQTCISLSNLRDAVVFMEQGLATVFQQMLQLKPDLKALPSDQAVELSDLSAQLYNGTSRNPIRVVDDRNKLLEDIRKKPGLESFLRPRSYHVLCQASQGGPIVILSSHPAGCDGILILNPISEPVHIEFPGVTPDILKSQKQALNELLGRCNVRTRDEAPSTRLLGRRQNYSCKPTHQCFQELLGWLWTNVVQPVYQGLKTHGILEGRIWWLPSSAFTGLPLHAAAGAQADNFIHSYISTLGSLVDAYNKRPSSSPSKVTVVGVTHTGPGRRDFLKGVERELQIIRSIVEEPYLECLEGAQATVDAVKMQIQDCSWAHMACHGSQVLSDPAKSSLHLYGGNLDLETILRMPFPHAQCVFLAACQTAKGDAQLVNESFHLGGGFIAAGFRSAIGTMWSMNDADGPMVAEIVYSYLFGHGQRPEAGASARALQLATQRLKDQQVSYERWVPYIHMGL
ncbi:CHAT domain-containing protein [Mycena vitilis]|nr:CHAT domain-containing protein [Mycena vitilis]